MSQASDSVRAKGTATLSIHLDSAAQRRLYVLAHVLAGEVTVAQAAALLRLSTRQVDRLARRFRAEGAAALVHGNWGRTPASRTAEAIRARLVELPTTEFAGFNPVHLAEVLVEEGHTDLAVSPRTIRRILAEAGRPPVRTRRSPRHRTRRERMPRAGMLLQVDGSRHDWLEGRGSVLTLIGAIDDATGIVTAATFRAAEDAAGYLEVFRRTVVRHGRPGAVYSDQHGIFIKDPNRSPTLAEQLAGRRSFTQVGRALDEAGIGWIGARSPQAKGRVERLWGTKQDRLVSELRRAGAATIEEANVVLARYLPRHNRRFTVPADPEPAWRPLAPGLRIDRMCCLKYRRVVANDHTVRAWATILQLPPSSRPPRLCRPAGRAPAPPRRPPRRVGRRARAAHHPRPVRSGPAPGTPGGARGHRHHRPECSHRMSSAAATTRR